MSSKVRAVARPSRRTLANQREENDAMRRWKMPLVSLGLFLTGVAAYLLAAGFFGLFFLGVLNRDGNAIAAVPILDPRGNDPEWSGGDCRNCGLLPEGGAQMGMRHSHGPERCPSSVGVWVDGLGIHPDWMRPLQSKTLHVVACYTPKT